MNGLIVISIVVLVIVAAVLHAAGKRRMGCWMLVLVSVTCCVGILQNLSLGVRRLGQGTIDNDHNQLAFCLFLLAVGLLAAFRPRLHWLFWVAWLLNAFICSILLYMIFFWKVFR
jgi:uncharacterized transporter YbjL